MKTLLFLSGPMGVGKTTACRTLLERLQPGAWLDGDWCWMMRPFSVTEETRAMVLDNITAVLSRFLACPELDYVLFSWVMHREEIAETILSRLDLEGVRVYRCALLCAPETLRRRLEGDVRAGLRTPDAVDRGLSYLPLYREQRIAKLMTDGLTPEEIAHRIVECAQGETI